jgi:hypothetical protein
MFPVSLTRCFSCFATRFGDGFSMLLILSIAIVSHSKVLTLLVLQWTIALSPLSYWCRGSHWSPTRWRFYYWGCWQSFGGAGAKRSCYCILQWVDYPDERRRSFVATHPEGEVWQDQGDGKFANCNTGNAIATLITITGTVIRKITIPVMLSWHIKHYRYGKFANYNTGNAIGTLITITGTVIKKLQYR